MNAYGLEFSHVVKATVRLHHSGRDFDGFKAAYAEFKEAHPPGSDHSRLLLGGSSLKSMLSLSFLSP